MTKIVRTVKYVRGPIGKIIKWLFIGFNLLMLLWLFSYWGDIAPMINKSSGAEQAGAAIGSTIGTSMILMFWVLGTVVLGIPVLLTKGKLVEIEEVQQHVSSPQDSVVISSAAVEKQLMAEPLKSNIRASKFLSSSKLILQQAGFAIFLLFGSVSIFTNSFISGAGMILAGSLLLPKVRERLVNTPLKSPVYTAAAMLMVVVFSTLLGIPSYPENNTAKLQEQQAQALTRQQDIKKEAEENFSRNPDQVIKDIAQYSAIKNWWMVKTKTELLLGTGNAEIKRLHDEAVAELAKEEEERQKQAHELLSSEFKEKRTTLIANLKKELADENYGYAELVGAEYIEVADSEFKKLHDTAVEKRKLVLEKEAAEAAAAPWSYFHTDDPMSKGVTHTAALLSSNAVEFDFPYNGAQNGRLTLRTDPRHGKDVIFSIEKGQILCSSYDGCTVLVRFDDEDATSYSASSAADNSTETIFIRNYSRFVEKMMKAKQVRISVNIYQEGAPVFDFDVSGFNSGKYKPSN